MMTSYWKHLCLGLRLDQDVPRNLRFCDGTMQRYLESRWFEETPETRDAVARASRRMNNVPPPRRS